MPQHLTANTLGKSLSQPYFLKCFELELHQEMNPEPSLGTACALPTHGSPWPKLGLPRCRIRGFLFPIGMAAFGWNATATKV